MVDPALELLRPDVARRCTWRHRLAWRPAVLEPLHEGIRRDESRGPL